MQENISFSEYQKIKYHFDELNQDKNHFVNSNDICTPIDCVKEMVDSVPNDFWQRDIKVLDSYCGNGNFHSYINTKTQLKNLYFNEINTKRVKNPVYIFLNNITRYGNFNNIRVLQKLPIFKSFNLNSEEINLIEKFNKKYYGKK